MSLAVTAILFTLSVVLIAWANWRERQETTLGEPPLVPYTVWQLIGVFMFILMAAHLITLLTGQPFVGRRGF